MTTAANAHFVEDLPKPCLRIDAAAGNVLWSNVAAQEYFGRSARSLAKTSVVDLFANLSDIGDIVSRVSTDRETIVVRDIDIGDTTAELTFFPVQQSVGLLVIVDRAMASRAMQGGSVRSLGQMIGHEIKNPLAGIKGAAQLLRDELRTDDARALVDVISSEIDRIRRLAVRLETFGDSDMDAMSRINVHTLLRAACKLMATSTENVVFTEDYDPSLPHVEGDSDRLTQAIINLLKNAIEAHGDREGEVILRTRSRAGARRDRVGLPVEIQIIDNGPGLPKSIQERVFEPFVTTKPSGQGLGLSLVAKAAEAHGGLVEVESRPGHTRFSILLPAIKDDTEVE